MAAQFVKALTKKSSAVRLASLLFLVLLLSGAPTGASGLGSQFLSADPAALAVMSGTPYDMNDPAWLVNVSDQNRDTFAYKLLAGLLMLGYQTEIAVNGNSWQAPQLLALNAFQAANGLPQSHLVSSACLSALDQQLTVREQELASIAPAFQLYGHMQPLHPNDISRDTLAAIYTIPMRALPKYLQMSTYEEVQCINGQCDGFIQDPSGNSMGWPIDLSADFRFVGAYFDPLRTNARLPSAAVHVDTVLHEYAHYLDGLYKVSSNDPLQTKFKIIDTTGFYAIGYDLSTYSNGCYVTRSLDPKDWITKYAAQMPGYGNCAAGSAVPDEDWAESFSMYVADGRDFRAAAGQSALLAQKYAWIRDQVFLGLEYDTDLVRDTESGCDDVYLYGATGVPAYAHCNNSYVWDFTLKPLASSVRTVPTALAPFDPQSDLEVSTQAASNAVTVAGINWPSAISVSGGEYSVNGGAYLSTPGTVDNGDTVALRQTSSASYSTQTVALLTIGGVSSSFSVTTRTPLQPTISGTPATGALTGKPYLFTPAASFALSYSLGGNVPPGLNFDPATGTLSGTPTLAGSYGPIIISALNGNLTAALPAFSITVSAPVGSFTQTGSLITGRMQGTATLLSTGKVLLAGGYDVYQQALASAELYDPATGTWSQAAAMSSGRAEQSATLLADGRVLVAGGYDENYSDLATAELYDPVADQWTALPPMSSARSSHTATLLPGGKVLVLGGAFGMENLSSAELYDPVSATWQAAASLAAGRSYHSATLLADGTVLAAGGYDGDWNPLASAESYDPAHDSSSAAPPLPQPRVVHSSTLLPDGTVLVTGGCNNDDGILSAVVRYDPVGGAWGAAAPLSTPRFWHAATLLKSGMVLASGGEGDSGYLADAELYNPSSDSWIAAGAMAFGQAYHSATLLSDGRVLLAGGSLDDSYSMTATQIFSAGITPDHAVGFTAGTGGSLQGVSAQRVADGGKGTTVRAVAASGYQFVNWTGSGGFAPTSSNPLTVADVRGDLAITANFALPVNGGCGGSDGASLSALPDTGLCAAGSASAVAGSGPWSWSCTGSYGGATASCSASAAVAPTPQYTVTPVPGSGFTLTPATPQRVDKNAAPSFGITPTPGFGIVTVSGCGGVWSGGSYAVGPVTADCAISVTAVARTATSVGATQPGVSDALKVLRAVVGVASLSAADQIRYDVAPLGSSGSPLGDGRIDISDALIILRRSIGIGSW